MKTLLLMRGCMGSGKSTWIKENGLDLYVLEPDAIRLMISQPEETKDGLKISQKHDKKVWALLYEILEYRMKNGNFTVIDAMHLKVQSCKKYIELANKYGYEIVYTQIDADLDTCLIQNKMRPQHKIVPEEIVKAAHETFTKNSEEFAKKFTRIYSLSL